MKRIAIIDGNSIMHRAFHAVPTYMMTTDGKHTNAVFGFISMLLKMVDEFSPDAVVCAFDAGIPDFRFEAVGEYKAQRPPMDPNLKEQFPLVEKLLDAMSIPVVKLDGWEGDDILGTLSARGDAEGDESLLVTGDRDIFQLASENTKVVATMKGLSEVKVYGPAEVRERYGVGPELVPDFIALKGDPSDNIPGVPGVGEKTAAKLLNQYGSCEEIVEHVDELKGKTRQNVEQNIDRIFAGRKVATIVRDLDLDIDLEEVEFPCFDPSRVVAAFKELGINSQISKVLALQEDDLDSSEGDGPEEELQIIEGPEAMDALEAFVSDGDGWASILLDASETDSLFESHSRLAVCFGVQVALFKDDVSIDAAISMLLGKGRMVALDAKGAIHRLIPQDSSKPAAIRIGDMDPERMFDLSIAGYLLDSSRSGYSLEYLAEEYLHIVLPTREKPKRGHPQEEFSDEELAKRARAELELMPVLEERLGQDGSADCFHEMEMPLVLVLVELERAGLELDVDRMAELSDQIGSQIGSIKQGIYDAAGEEFNIDSPKQLSGILFDKLGLPPKKKTRTGYSTDASVLESLSDKHPVPGLVLEYRELNKIKNTYLDTLPKQVGDDGRVHTTFNQTVTATGRLSSSDPNLQNIPGRTDLGRQIRTAFVPYSEMRGEDGDPVFLSADYSQIELRLLAHLSGDQGLIDAFRHGSDFHASTAARIFGIEPDEVTPALRSRAKAVNFGIVYGQQAFGLARSLKIPMREAQEMIDRYFDAYPKVKEYLDGLVEQARSCGYVETMYGRKRHVPEVLSTNANQRQAGEREAMNHPMQGTAADIIKLAMVAMEERLHEEGMRSVMVLQIHDELDFSCPASEIDRLSEMVVDVMENIVHLDVPMSVSVSYGPTWADAK